MTPVPAHDPLVIALVAGEDSGDALGADLVAALRRRFPRARLVGVGGPRMVAAGFEAWHGIDALSVMGIAEVLAHLPRLLRLRRRLGRRLAALRPDLFVGIDAPDFNLGLERRLKRAGIRTAHYVSPSIWAWREGRAKKMAASADRVLCLLPMEPPIYARHGVDARFVGHPLADAFAMAPDRAGARAALGLPADAPVLAVLPGSRSGEIARLGAPFLDAAQRVAAAIPGLRVIVPTANARCRAMLDELAGLGTDATGPGTRDPGPDSDKANAQTDAAACSLASPEKGAEAAAPVDIPPTPGPGSRVPGPEVIDGRAREALIAADLVLVASGTAALEAMLAKRPMVVGYRIAPLTYHLVRALKLMKTEVYSLPNILAARALVPELMQGDCQAGKLADALLALHNDTPRCDAMVAEFARQHARLGGGDGAGAADNAAAALADLLEADHAPT